MFEDGKLSTHMELFNKASRINLFIVLLSLLNDLEKIEIDKEYIGCVVIITNDVKGFRTWIIMKTIKG